MNGVTANGNEREIGRKRGTRTESERRRETHTERMIQLRTIEVMGEVMDAKMEGELKAGQTELTGMDEGEDVLMRPLKKVGTNL